MSLHSGKKCDISTSQSLSCLHLLAYGRSSLLTLESTDMSALSSLWVLVTVEILWHRWQIFPCESRGSSPWHVFECLRCVTVLLTVHFVELGTFVSLPRHTCNSVTRITYWERPKTEFVKLSGSPTSDGIILLPRTLIDTAPSWLTITSLYMFISFKDTGVFDANVIIRSCWFCTNHSEGKSFKSADWVGGLGT